MPVLIIVIVFTFAFNNTLSLVLEQIQERNFIPSIALCVIVALYNRILTALINSGYDRFNEEIRKGNTVPISYKFIVYACLVLIGTAIHIGIVFLMMHLLLKIW